MPSRHSERHAEACRVVTMREMHEKVGFEPRNGWDDPRLDEIGFSQCVDGCPSLEAVKAKGRELAERYGW